MIGRRLKPMPVGIALLLVGILFVFMLAMVQPGLGVLLAVAIALFIPGRLWKWRIRHFTRGVRALEDGEPAEAREELETFLEGIDDDELFRRLQPLFNLGQRYSYRAAARSNLGLATLEQGAPREALETFEAALTEDPDHPQAHYGRALTLRRLGDLEGAEEAAEASLEVRPGYLAAHALLGLIRRERGDDEGAERTLEAIRKDGRDPEGMVRSLREIWPGAGEARAKGG
ncbi:MAG: tetratricopeptide repeat protein [Gemmatimonadota bacterium]